MATSSKPVGYECEFVDQVPEDYFCKLCKHVAREPNITSCCGEIICKACVDVITQDKKPCPSCEDLNITSYPQVKYQRKILALEVRCTMKDRICPWIGQLQLLDAHLDVTTGDCQYVDVECPKECDQKVQKRNVDTHLANECPNRDYRCPHCNFKATFHVVSDHFEVCSYYPLACPNRCGVTFERNDLEDHMKMCRLEEVQCVFSDAGCEAKFIRDNQDEHMDQNTQKHLALMLATTQRISQDFEQKLQEKDEQIRKVEQKLQEQQQEFERKFHMQSQEFEKKFSGEQKALAEKDTQITALKEQLQKNDQQHQQTINQIRREIGMPPYDITFLNYQKVRATLGSIYSLPMYTHPWGYRFRLKIWTNYGLRGTHVAVFVFSVKGDHDAVLKFPATFTITLQLLNQHRDQDHYTRDIQCEVTRERTGSSFYSVGYQPTFILHTDLGWNQDKQTQYLKNDCLKFRITKIVL